MIAQVFGRLVTREIDHVEIMTEGGVAYELAIPLSAYEALPKVGDTATLHTHLVVREDGWQLYGFATPFERRVFRRVLDAKGVGPALALGMLSALSAERLVRAIRERDIATLQSVPRALPSQRSICSQRSRPRWSGRFCTYRPWIASSSYPSRTPENGSNKKYSPTFSVRP